MPTKSAKMLLRYRVIMVFGILLTLVGVGAIITGGLNFAFRSYLKHLAVGIWAGAWVMIAGLIGAASGFMQNKALAIAFMVLCISTAVLFVAPIEIIAAVDIVRLFFGPRWYSDVQSYDAAEAKAVSGGDGPNSYWPCKRRKSKADPTDDKIIKDEKFVVKCHGFAAIHNNYALIACGVLAFWLAIIGASVSCCVFCACCGAAKDEIMRNSVAMQSYSISHVC